MTWIYHQSSGEIYHDDELVGTGYSGKGFNREEGRNNSDLEAEYRVGPIPRGRWQIGEAYDSEKAGPISMRLSAIGHHAHGRSGFLIHGNNSANDASRGCIVLNRTIRLLIADSPDRSLEVL